LRQLPVSCLWCRWRPAVRPRGAPRDSTLCGPYAIIKPRGSGDPSQTWRSASRLITVAGLRRLKNVRPDLLYLFREVRRKPGLALTAIISLALGIGATTAVFNVIA